LTDVAHPICDADRHVKKELKKKIRGIRELERTAETSPSQDAPMVADYCWAMRTVMRDDGKYPLEPPGVQLYQKVQLRAASVERVMVAPPSALRKKLSRMLSVLNLFHKEYAQLVILFSWVYQIAHRLKAQPSCEEAQAQLLTLVHELKHSGLPTERLRVMTYVEKITVAFAPHLFEYLKQPLLPRTNNDLELFIGRIKKSRRHITGRKNTQEFILREGTFVAILFGLPQPDSWVEAFSRVNPHDFHHHLTLVRPIDKRRQCWHVRRDLPAYLAALARPWVTQEVVLQR
jgi:hypothetical protein